MAVEDKTSFSEELSRVQELIALSAERLEEGPAEWLLDFNLPDLYVAIHGLYSKMGESDRLERHLAMHFETRHYYPPAPPAAIGMLVPGAIDQDVGQPFPRLSPEQARAHVEEVYEQLSSGRINPKTE